MANNTFQVPELTLSDGNTIPQLGFGVARVEANEAQRVVEDALAAGYRHIDTAAQYDNEEGVGAAVAASDVPREQIFVTTKLDMLDQSDPRASIEASLERMGLDYFDLYLIHWPLPERGTYPQVWQEFEKFREEGLARSIGVSNFLPEHLDELAKVSDTVPVVNQVELHPTFQNLATQRANKERGIITEAWSPLGNAAALDHPEVVKIAERLQVTPAQAILAWHLAEGRIVIPKTLNPDRMTENLGAVNVELSEQDLADFDALDTDQRIGRHPAEVN